VLLVETKTAVTECVPAWGNWKGKVAVYGEVPDRVSDVGVPPSTMKFTVPVGGVVGVFGVTVAVKVNA
jgi:hypothetical protein